MFSIFQKKEFLKDHLEGITDIHNHILPGIDDGATNLEDSLQLLRRFKSIGISGFICTPHIMNDYYPNNAETIETSLSKVKDGISFLDDLKGTRIRYAAEYMMDQSFLDLLEQEELLTLKEKYVLVEMSYFQAPINLKEILFQLQTHGYKPVLAHPERYAYYHSKDLRRYEELKNRGCLFQVNALSLSTHYGTNMQQIAFKLLEAEMIDFIGTDTHREQHLDKLERIRLNKKTSSQVKKVVERTREIFSF